jgi:photosystem II stability/assembly factor-like uncharacterized protein
MAAAIFYPKDNGLPTQSSGAICTDPHNGDIMYYATGGNLENFLYNYYGLGVFKSTDGGDHWTGGYNTGLPKQTFSYRITVDPGNSSIVYLAERTGLFRSTDAGVTWNKAVDDINGSQITGSCSDVVASINGVVYAVGGVNGMYPTTSGIGYWKSTNSGLNFHHMTSSGFAPDQRTQIAVCKQQGHENYVYAVTVTMVGNDVNLYAFISTDYGQSFGSPIFITTEAVCPNCGMQGDFLFVEVSPFDHLTAFAGFGNGSSDGLHKTTNGGNNWPKITTFGWADRNCLDFNPDSANSKEILLGYDQGLSRSTDFGGTWELLNSTLTISETYRVTSANDNSNFVLTCVEDGGYVRTTNNGNSWNYYQYGGDGTNVLFSALDPNPDPNYKHALGSKGATGSYSPLMHYSSDGGYYWDTTDMTGYWDGNEDWIAVLKEDPKIPGVFFCPLRDADTGKHTQIDINLSNNYGQHWNSSHSDGNFTPIPTGDRYESPQSFSMCEKDTNIIYVSTIDFIDGSNMHGSRVWKTTNAGQSWHNLDVNNNGVPNRYISSVVADPVDYNEAYLGLSGFKTGHVFKTTNGGGNWFDISGTPGANGSLPDLPVNYMIVRYISPQNQFVKQIIVATDAGVYVMDECEVCGAPYLGWREVATGLPNSIAMGMDFNEASLKLRVATFGRSIYETQLDGPVYVYNQMVLRSSGDGLNVGDDIVVGSGATLSIPAGGTIKMPAGKKITIQDGGHLNVTSNDPVYFTSQSGSWGGIEFQGNATGTLANCTFNNTSTPITIVPNSGLGTSFGNTPYISISYCSFSSGPISITNRRNVTIDNCTWNYSSTTSSSVCGVDINGSSNVTVQWCSINYAASGNTVMGISVVQSSGANVSHNFIRNASVGIFASNSDANIRFNNIGTTGGSADIGIGLDNCTNPVIIYDTVDSYIKGISLDNGSSAVMHDNKVTNSGTYGMDCNNSSNPRLTPTATPDGIYWDAGLNILKSTTNGGDGIYIANSSVPILAEGYNTIWGGNYYLDGSGLGKWSVTDNCWVDDPPVSGKFHVFGKTITYSPYSCTPPSGASSPPKANIFGLNSNVETEISADPPQPLIVDYGNGVFDTIKVSTANIQVQADMAAYFLATKQALQSNFTDAINSYKQVIQNYRDSTCAIEAMKKILYCTVRMHADTSAYTDLRNYYLSLASAGGADTAFKGTAAELSRKCLVRKLELQNAIGEYENVVQHSTNHSDSVSAEINIIEVYMLMASGGGDSKFTGRLGYLKPLNALDGLRMIKEKLYNLTGQTRNVEIPKQFSLSQNYPNPFNPVTKIKYALPNPVKVNIKIYDILGRLVKTLVNDEFKDAGFYEVTFDGSNFASGVYFYRIEAGKFVQSKKMVILK